MHARAEVRAFVLPLFASVVAFSLATIAQGRHAIVAQNDVLLASAWLHGHAWIAYPGTGVDAVPFHGRAYVVEGPAPAVLLVPFVLVSATPQSQATLAHLLAGVAVFALWRLAACVGLKPGVTAAVVAFVFFGTSLYTCATLGEVWYLAHVTAFAFTLLAIGECAGRGRSALIALYALLAAFSREPLFAALPLYAIALYARKGDVRALLPGFLLALPAFGLAIAYDLARFGTIGDPGFSIWFRTMDYRARLGTPLFGLVNVPRQFATFVLNGPTFSSRSPFVLVPPDGFSILWTSLPFAYGAVAARTSDTALLGVAALATALPAFTYYDTGHFQFGMRHALDFEPFLAVLLVLALARRPSRAIVAALLVFTVFGAIEGTLWLRA